MKKILFISVVCSVQFFYAADKSTNKRMLRVMVAQHLRVPSIHSTHVGTPVPAAMVETPRTPTDLKLQK